MMGPLEHVPPREPRQIGQEPSVARVDGFVFSRRSTHASALYGKNKKEHSAAFR